MRVTGTHWKISENIHKYSSTQPNIQTRQPLPQKLSAINQTFAEKENLFLAKNSLLDSFKCFSSEILLLICQKHSSIILFRNIGQLSNNN